MRSIASTVVASAFFVLTGIVVAGGCASSSSDQPACIPPQVNCGDQCINTTNAHDNCGACGHACAASESCVAGACTLACPTGQTACGDTCATLASDVANCGACGKACAAGEVCSNGACATSCAAALVDCGGSCVDPKNDRDHCGATSGCGTSGGNAGEQCKTGELCVAGACTVSCPGTEIACGGACIDPQTDRNHCGASANCGADPSGTAGVACKSGELCVAGKCAVSCPGNEIACGGTCVDPRNDRNHCGASGACDAAAGTGGVACDDGDVCVDGKCAATCPFGEIACNGSCIDPLTSAPFCGATVGCGVAGSGSAGTPCPPGQACVGGSCAPNCASNEVACGGACIDPKTNRSFCGAAAPCDTANGSAGTACTSGQICSGGSCVTSCLPNQVSCGGACIDPKTDRVFCGATNGCGVAGTGSAGTPCASGQACVAGVCSTSCPGTQVNCGGTCVDPKTDNAHCGAQLDCTGTPNAGVACSGGQVCSGGVCGATCGGNTTLCSGACVDEHNDPNHCGGCSACGVPSGASVSDCRSSQCAVAKCQSGFADCDGTFSNGCEVNTTNDQNNCGGCGDVCAGELCIAGTCTAPVFDSLTGSVSVTTRGVGDSCGTAISVATGRTITRIAVKNNLSGAGNIKFLVFNHSTGALLFVSSAQPVAANGDTWKLSTPLSFALVAGTQYDIGAITDVGGTWDFDTYAETSAGLSSLTQNPNFSNFASPTRGGSGGADCAIRLF